jgi:SAM-dependent methyltransferase
MDRLYRIIVGFFPESSSDGTKMSLLDKAHGGFVFPLRIGRLAQKIAGLVPAGARILDVGCGDGRVAFEVSKLRPDVRLEGIDVLIRKETLIPVTRFDGERIPYGDASHDVVMLIDVLHHTHDPQILLREAKRVARQAIVIKDHTRDGFLAGPRLRFMDWVGNARHGVVLPYNYWPGSRWHSELKNLGFVEDDWSEKLHLYPWWANWLFGSSLHFVARLHLANS